MCGRYFIDDEVYEMLHLFKRIRVVRPQFDFSQMAVKEIFPTNTCLTLTGIDGLTPNLMKWGYPKWDGKGVIINARSESITEKPMFRNDIRTNRCLIVSSGFFEWDSGKKRYYIKGDEDILYMAGVYQLPFINAATTPDETRATKATTDIQEPQRIPTFAIVTKPSTGALQEIHDRMPILLRRKDIGRWLGNEYPRLLGQ